LIAERIAIETKLIRDTVRGVRATGAERIGGRIRIEFVEREVAEIFSLDRERDENQKTREQEFSATPPTLRASGSGKD
jgi:hypothetical protein